MKRVRVRAAAGFVGIGALLLTVVGLTSQPVHADVEDFYFSSFVGDYYLSKDSDGRSMMKVEEELTAEFPDYNQNKGIIRAIPLKYDGHPVSLEFDNSSLTRNGAHEPVYEKTRSNGNLNVSTGTDEYVTGTQVYRLSYTMRDVTKEFGDHAELYWDTNGTGWRQGFDSVVARVHLDPSVEDAFNGTATCYQGAEGEDEECVVSKSKDADGNTLLTFSSTRMFGPGENLTLAAAFEKGTFQPYAASADQVVWQVIQFLPLVASLGALIGAIYIKTTRGRDAAGHGTTVPEYLPPKNVSVLVAADVVPNSGKAVAAQIIDLAVRHNIQIVEYDKPQLIFGQKKAYKLRFLNANGMNQDEQAFASIIFGSLTEGAEYDMGDTTAARLTGMRIAQHVQLIGPSMVRRELRRKVPKRFVPVAVSGGALLLMFLLTLIQSTSSVPIVDPGVLIAVVFVVTVIIGALMGTKLPLSDSGKELQEYVLGVKMYIKVAEEERLKVLQSVEGAERVDVNDHAQLVKLYERVLPYAVLFGLEKSWGKVMELYYEPNSAPSWYVGTTAFSMSTFTSSISSFAASTSSSTGGAGGGGSSGGGGGGGGGGGR